ncbi:MAG: type VI secretion system contractile sheath large subunit, partial [Desulfatiglandaceae bacterium]
MVEEEKQAASTEETTEELSILDEIVHATKIRPTDEAYGVTKRGVEALIAQLLEPGRVMPKISKAVVDDMIAEIDKKLSLQLDAVMHHPEVQKLESAWRSLKFFVDRTDFRENIKLE